MSSYLTPEAFKRALTDKLRMKAKESRFTLPQLQRQIAGDVTPDKHGTGWRKLALGGLVVW